MAEYQVRPSEVMVVFYGLQEATQDTTQAIGIQEKLLLD
jgi:hypothetical protein